MDTRNSQPGSSAGATGAPAPAAAASRPVDDRTVVATPQVSIGHTLPGGGAAALPGGDAMPARQVGRYRIVEKLGEGAMATVYRAYDPSIDRMLAIKFLHRDLCVDAEYRGRFLREAKAAGVLSHPNIVTVFDVGEIEGRPYIAMELLDGGPLNETLKEGVGLPIGQVIDFGMQIASALDYAHARGIFHRDIKPSNIVRLKDDRTVKVTDFGIAHVDSGGTTQQTRVGTVIGTPHYMSPEQAMGQKVDARSDLFSVGVMLYQLISGYRPFDGESIVTLAVKIAKQDPRPLDQLRKDVPPALRRIVDRCLAKAPEKRFQSGNELAQALERVKLDLAASADRRGRPRIVPLRVKWTLTMAVVVAATMAVTALFVNQRQYQAMMAQMVGQGASLSRLIAAESAVSVLGEDWVGIDVSLQEAAKALGAQSLSMIDREGTVRVSSDPATVGKKHQRAQGEPVAAPGSIGVEVQRRDLAGRTVLDFETPVTFQERRIGTVNLLLPEQPLADVARQSWWLMLLLVIITAAAVTAATYYIADRYSKPIRLVRDSMDEIGKGRFDYRIAEKRDDEFGELFEAFDRMAANLETLGPAGRPAPATADDRTVVTRAG
jgi:serine/threonine-protein kinase